MKTGVIILIVACILAARLLYVHRRVIRAAIKHQPIPKAPKWHFWVKNRRS